jgi:RNA polymerase sigma-70 factor (ECF subfamily)
LCGRRQKGDVDAFAELMAALDPDMLRVAMVATGNRDAAREAVQIAWPIAWKKLRMLRDPRSVRPWLMSIAANAARRRMRTDLRRAQRELKAWAPPDRSASDPSSVVEHIDLQSAIARLSVADRRLVALRYVGGLTSLEISELDGRSPAAIRARLARVVAQLRKDLEHG